jgi:serine/threonine-protein kinase
MHDSTASGAHDGDRESHSSNDLTAPVPTEGTIDHVSTPATGTVDVPAEPHPDTPDGTLDYPHATGDGTEALGGGTIDHVPASGDGTERDEDADGHTVDPAQGKWVGGPQASKTAPPVRRKDALPKTVAGYDILGVLGRGAMGVVYKARQRGLNRLVALKMILSGAHASEHELGRFRTEAEAVARIQHPNIVQIYEVGEEDGRPFFSLEYVDGGSLERKVKGKPQQPAEAARLVQALAAAMDCAHRANVIHRDLKPANVLLAADGTPKITDFGLAKRLEDDSGQTHSGSIIGTPSYMSPEQADGRIEDISPLADVWSLGAILYELLTGRVPFHAPKVLETLEQVRTREPVAPTELQPGIPRDLETICLKCLQKDPAKRYASAGVLTEDLRRFLNNEPILARPVGRLERGWRWCKRNPRLAITGGVAAAAMLAFICSVMVAAAVWKSERDAKELERDRADHNASDAELKREEAEKNEKLAKDNEAKAIKNEQRANKEAELAKNQHQNALLRYTQFGEAMLRLLNAGRFRQMGSEVRGLRDNMLNLLRQGMMTMARDLEQAEATSFGTAGSHQRMGRVLRNLGQGEEALKQYRLAVTALERNGAEQPNSDRALANLAIMRAHVADMYLELYGEARRARDAYEENRRIRQEIADHPRSNDYTDLENKSNLAHYEMRLGIAEMALGDPVAARGHFHKAMELRKALSEAEPEKDDARSYLVEAYLWLATASWHSGDDPASRAAFAEALSIQQQLIKKNPPTAFWYKADLATILCDRGDAELAAGRDEQAESSYREALANLRIALEKRPNHAEDQLRLTRLKERLAVIAARTGDAAGAKRGWEEVLELRKEFIEMDRNNLVWLASAFRASANCGRFHTAVRQLEMLYRKRPQSIPILLDTARACAVGVAMSADAAVKQRYVERAVGALHTAVRAGYKDSIALKTDPELAPLRKEPLFVALVARMGK